MTQTAPTDWRQRAVASEEVLRELLHAIDDGDALPHPTERNWDRVAIYVRSVAVSAAREIVANG